MAIAEQCLPFEGLVSEARLETLHEGLALYEHIYMPSRNFAAKTRLDYHNDLEDLIAFLEKGSLRRLNQLSLRDLEAYLAELDRRGYAGASRKRKTYAIKSFFSFLYRSGYADEDLAERLIPPKTEQKEPRVLTKPEYEALLRACSHHVRDSAIIELLLQTGLRLSEVAHLTTGECPDLGPALDGGGNLATLEALTQSTLYAVPRERFLGLMYQDEGLSLAAATYLASEVRRVSMLARDLALHTVRARLARFLLTHAEGNPAQHRWTQEMIAAHIGTIRDVVGRSLRAFVEEGLIRRERGRLVVVDHEALRREAGA